MIKVEDFKKKFKEIIQLLLLIHKNSDEKIRSDFQIVLECMKMLHKLYSEGISNLSRRIGLRSIDKDKIEESKALTEEMEENLIKFKEIESHYMQKLGFLSSEGILSQDDIEQKILDIENILEEI